MFCYHSLACHIRPDYLRMIVPRPHFDLDVLDVPCLQSTPAADLNNSTAFRHMVTLGARFDFRIAESVMYLFHGN